MKFIPITTAAALVASVVSGVSGAAANNSQPNCHKLAGPRWTDSYDRHGTMYAAWARGVTCAFVRTWVPRVALSHPDGTGLMKGAPPGFECFSQGVSTLAHSFECQDKATKGRRQSFSVVPEPS